MRVEHRRNLLAIGADVKGIGRRYPLKPPYSISGLNVENKTMSICFVFVFKGLDLIGRNRDGGKLSFKSVHLVVYEGLAVLRA